MGIGCHGLLVQVMGDNMSYKVSGNIYTVGCSIIVERMEYSSHGPV